MPISDFQTIMLPLMRDLAGGERSSQETLDALASDFGVTPADIALRIPSGRAPKFANRIGWAKSHLKIAGAIESPRRGVYHLTARGRKLLGANLERITLSVLNQFPEYVAFRTGERESVLPEGVAGRGPAAESLVTDERTPNDLIDPKVYVRLATRYGSLLHREASCRRVRRRPQSALPI